MGLVKFVSLGLVSLLISCESLDEAPTRKKHIYDYYEPCFSTENICYETKNNIYFYKNMIKKENGQS